MTKFDVLGRFLGCHPLGRESPSFV